jgi:FAD/FMN-containing dehydrogenase
MGTNDIDTLKESFSGTVILPGDDGYEEACTTRMGIKGAPAVVVRPHDPKDVARAIVFAKDNGLIISVRCGGHSGAGHSNNTGGLVIDLSDINDVELIDEAQHTVRIGGGATWIKIAETLKKHDLAISSGDTKTVGVGGLTLGGGIGWMVRKYGLALDNLIAAEVVTSDGEIIRASESEHADLFWAIRGGGGNFGVVTSFEFMAHPTHQVYAGTIIYGFDDLPAVLKGWRDHMRVAPEELTTMLMMLPSIPAFGDQLPSVMIMVCFAGDDENAARDAIHPLALLGKVVSEDIKKKDYADVLEDAHAPEGVKIVVNNGFFPEFSDNIIDAIAKMDGQILQIRSIGGAMNRVAPEATAFAHRASEVFIVSPLFLAPDASDADIQKAQEPWHTISGSASGSYGNLLTESTQKEVKMCYPEATYKRLAQVKAKYDPQNTFNQNYNIIPAEATN